MIHIKLKTKEEIKKLNYGDSPWVRVLLNECDENHVLEVGTMDNMYIYNIKKYIISSYLYIPNSMIEKVYTNGKIV